MSTSFPTFPRPERADAAWAEWRVGLPEPRLLTDRGTGDSITDRRSSWVRRVGTPRGVVFVKTYEYATWPSRFANLGRWTRPGAATRPSREFDALQWLRANDFAGPTPLAVFVWRRCAFVERASLVTTSFGEGSAEALLPTLATDERRALAAAIGAFVRALHARGFRDRNLDLRNLLVERVGAAWRLAKIDSPRHVLRAPGAATDALARADWDRLRPQLRAFDLEHAVAGD